MTRHIMRQRRSAQPRSNFNHSDYRCWPSRLLVARGWMAAALHRPVSSMWPALLAITFFLVWGIATKACSGTDVFRSSGGSWQVSFGGTGPWTPINTSSIGIADLTFGDFD